MINLKYWFFFNMHGMSEFHSWHSSIHSIALAVVFDNHNHLTLQITFFKVVFRSNSNFKLVLTKKTFHNPRCFFHLAALRTSTGEVFFVHHVQSWRLFFSLHSEQTFREFLFRSHNPTCSIVKSALDSLPWVLEFVA